MLELLNRTATKKPEPQTTLKSIGRITAKSWFRFHTTHVRNVRMTVRLNQYDPTKEL